MKKIFYLITALLILITGCNQTAKEYSNKGNAKSDLQDRRKAMDYWDSGNAKGDLQDYRGAIADYNKAIELTPNDGDFYISRALAKNALQDYMGAIADYTKVIDLKEPINRINIMAYHNRGNAKSYLQDYRGAIADYTKVIELDPNNMWAYYYRGLVKIELGQTDSGCLDLSKAGELGYSEAYEAIKKYCL